MSNKFKVGDLVEVVDDYEHGVHGVVIKIDNSWQADTVAFVDIPNEENGPIPYYFRNLKHVSKLHKVLA